MITSGKGYVLTKIKGREERQILLLTSHLRSPQTRH